MSRFDLSTVQEPPRREAGSLWGRLRDELIRRGLSLAEAEERAAAILESAAARHGARTFVRPLQRP